MEATKTIVPPPRACAASFRWGRNARERRKAGQRLRSRTERRSASSASAKRRAPEPPRLLTRRSIAPNAPRVPEAAARTPGSVVRSPARPIAPGPSARASATAASRSGPPREARATRHPSRARASAIAQPMPRLLPLTNAARPASPRSMRRPYHVQAPPGSVDTASSDSLRCAMVALRGLVESARSLPGPAPRERPSNAMTRAAVASDPVEPAALVARVGALLGELARRLEPALPEALDRALRAWDGFDALAVVDGPLHAEAEDERSRALGLAARETVAAALGLVALVERRLATLVRLRLRAHPGDRQAL